MIRGSEIPRRALRPLSDFRKVCWTQPTTYQDYTHKKGTKNKIKIKIKHLLARPSTDPLEQKQYCETVAMLKSQ
jgi:Txe/YoeB family toxin of Txe-Axe toxin-antitoxin module